MHHIEQTFYIVKLNKLTTQPEPCKAAPSAFIFCTRASKEPKSVSIVHPSELCGGSPPPS